MTEAKRSLKIFLCHIMPVGYAHIIPSWDADTTVGALRRDAVSGLLVVE